MLPLLIQYAHLSVQVIAEGVPQMVKCLVVVGGVLYFPEFGLTIFLLAQVSA